jgi:hypothetical protein
MLTVTLFSLLSCTRSGDTDAELQPFELDLGRSVAVCDGSRCADVHIDFATAFDPTGSPLQVEVRSDAPVTVSVRLVDDAGEVAWSAETAPGTADAPALLTWNGSSGGVAAKTGLYQLQAAIEGGLLPPRWQTLGEVGLVRAGFSAAYATDDGGATSLRIPLYWHGESRVQEATQAISQLAQSELADGTPASFPAVSAALDVHGEAEPTAWKWDSKPIYAFSVTDVSRYGDTGLAQVDVGLEAEGWTVISGVPIRPGVQVVLQKQEPLSATIGVVEDTIDLRFTAADSRGQSITIASQALPVRMYATLGASGFSAGTDLYHPWVAAIDPALRGIDGTVPEHDAVIDALTEWVYTQADLTYDTRYGASAYVDYGRRWDTAKFFFSDFLDRNFGRVVNCTDCASILLTYANMLGARLSYTIILENFSLNQIKSIGGTRFTNCPFGPSGCGFSYHAVTTDDAGGTIWDATLTLDGDDDPSAAPNTELLVQHIAGDEYLDRLVMTGSAAYYYESQGTIQ